MKAILHHTGKELTRHNDVLLVLGDGRSMPEDRERFYDWDVKADIAAIGRAIKTCNEHASHWFNADGETAIAWAKQIKGQSRNGLMTHTLGPVDGFDVDWDLEQPDYRYEEITNERGRMHGSSAMFATLAGVAMGYGKIVLAGCPMDAEGHWYFPQSKETMGPIWLGMDYMAWIDFSHEEQAARVRSMSGYTAKILGKAEKRWIYEMC